MIVAQITDMHVRRKGDLLHHMVHTGRELRRALADLEALVPQPDLVIATGDLVDRGKPREYRRLRTILDDSSLRVYVVAGNHDERDALRATFGDDGYLPHSGPLHYTIETRPLRVIVLDTTDDRKRGGVLAPEQLAWLEAQLAAAPAVPALIAMHHPPFELGIPLIDSPALRGRDDLAAIVRTHPQVVRIIAGHVHQFATCAFAGTIAATAPSTAQQLVMERAGPDGLRVRIERPGYVLHRWTGRTLEVELMRTGEGATAMPRSA